jgi:hypothetical protein
LKGAGRPVPYDRPQLPMCRQAAIDEVTGAWPSRAAAGYAIGFPGSPGPCGPRRQR